MSEDAHRLFDTIIKALTALVALGVAIYGVLQYVETSRNNSATQTVEREKLLIEKTKMTFELNRQKSEVLNRAAQIAADATWTADRNERLKAIDRYTRVFVGELSLVANDNVIRVGDELNERLNDMKVLLLSIEKKRTRKYNVSTDLSDEHKLYVAERNSVGVLNAFVEACRRQIAEDFLGELKGRSLGGTVGAANAASAAK